MSIQSINPATGETLETFTETSAQDLERILATAHAAFAEWRHTAFGTRGGLMRKAAEVLRARKVEYARTMALEMGKPIAQGEAEVDKCAWVCDYYAEHAEAMLAEQPRSTDASRSYVRFDPLGTVLAVMPWNFPFWQVFRFAAPALMAGNAGVLKHASNVPRCALQIEEVFRDAGFPRGLFATALVGSKAVPGIIADPRIVAATLTGSEHAGSQVAERAGRELKKTVLELGGSDAVHRARGRRRRRGGPDGGRRAAGQQRPELHRRQALHRGRGGRRPVPGALRRRAAQPADGRSAVARHPGGAAGARRSARRAPPAGAGVDQARRPAAAGRRGPAGHGRVLSADAPGRGRQGDAGLRRGDVRARRGRHPGQGRGRRRAPRQRLGLRPRRLAVDAQTAPGPSGWPRRSRRARCSSTGS